MMTAAAATAAGYAVLVWWFTTGIILFLDGLPRYTFRWSLSAAGALMLAAVYTLHTSAADVSSAGAYTSFTCAIVIWGWLEMSFLMGYVTGPRKHSCSPGCGGAAHFLHATQAIIYNELATLAGFALVWASTWHAPNHVGLWTYEVLWAMRLSAKLNLFLGVPNLGEKFLPPHLLYLKGFFRKRAMNFLFPVSVMSASVVTVLLVQKCVAAGDPFTAVGYALVSSLLGLAVLEHWFMVLPLPSENLWSWGFKSAQRRDSKSQTGLAVKTP